MTKRTTAFIGLMAALVLSSAFVGPTYAEANDSNTSPAHRGWFMGFLGKIQSFFRHSDGDRTDKDKRTTSPIQKRSSATGTVTAISGADITVGARDGSNATTSIVVAASGATIYKGSRAATSSVSAIAIGDRLLAYGSSTDSGFSAKTIFVGDEDFLKRVGSQVKPYDGRGTGNEEYDRKYGPAQPYRDERPER